MTSRLASTSAVALAFALAFAGCGGSARPATTVSLPRIPHALGTAFAARADRVARELQSGDGCAASADAVRLSAALDRAAASGTMPRRLQVPALTAVRRLQSAIVCRPATTASATTNAATGTTTNSCGSLRPRRQGLEQQKQSLDERRKEIDKLYKGKEAAARKHALDVEHHRLDEEEHALDQQLHGCQ